MVCGRWDGLSLPFGFVKMRMPKMTALPDGTMPYKSSIDCALKVRFVSLCGGV